MSEITKYRVPGRINLIGEHTDYNYGWVLPAAIDKHLIFEVERIDGDLFQFYSYHYDQLDTCDRWGNNSKYAWSKFFRQVISLIASKGFTVAPLRCAFGGDLPIGAGMSSSSALTCGWIFALNDLFDLNLSLRDMVFLASEAEQASGLDGGKMDQYAIILGKKDHLLKIDCQDYSNELIPAKFEDYELTLFDTRVEHELVDSEYNTRHATCKRGIALIAAEESNITSLRDLNFQILEKHKSLLDNKTFSRLNYVLHENDRVHQTESALKNENYNELGRLLYESHHGLQYEYEVSCEELDFIVDWTKEYEEILGARMMGGGFGGCVIALIEKGFTSPLFQKLQLEYQKQFELIPHCYPVVLSDGVRRM